jgi:hypothetical protein
MAFVGNAYSTKAEDGICYPREVVLRGAVLELFCFARQKYSKDSSFAS